MQSRHDLIVEPIGLDLEQRPKPLAFAELFGNSNPIELEIGMGKGTFITEQALARPETNFFGLEYANFYYRYASDRLRRNHCANARTARAEAAFFLKEFVAAESISVLHIYFPDPWPKKRHHKRRLIQEGFLREVHRILIPGGRVQIATDHADYFAHIEPILRSSPLRPVDFNAPTSAAAGEITGTNFERKYRREGRPFHALAAIK